MKKLILFVLTVACLAGAVFLIKDSAINSVKMFKNALEEVDQWKTLM